MEFSDALMVAGLTLSGAGLVYLAVRYGKPLSRAVNSAAGRLWAHLTRQS